MSTAKLDAIKKHLYNDTPNAAKDYIHNISDEETLSIYANNYNWDNGFTIPTAIINNKACSLSVALQVFWLADGISYLETKEKNATLPEWSKFIADLYDRINNNSFPKGKVAFSPELSKVQLYKLKKALPDSDQVFITDIEGIDCNIIL